MSTRRPMFAEPVAPPDPVRRGRGLAVAFLLHGLALTPLFVSTTQYEAPLVPAAESEGVTFIMAPLRGVGSPPPAARPAAPERTQPPGERVERVDPEPPIELELAMAAPVAITPPVLGAPDEPSDAGDDVGPAEANRVPEPEPPGSGQGGRGDSAPPPAIGTASGRSNWAGLVLGRLEQFRRYPRAARRDWQEGVCYVRFTIDRQGHVHDVSLSRTSGYVLLDREAVTLVHRADPLPAPPTEIEGETVTLTVPVEFFISPSR